MKTFFYYCRLTFPYPPHGTTFAATTSPIIRREAAKTSTMQFLPPLLPFTTTTPTMAAVIQDLEITILVMKAMKLTVIMLTLTTVLPRLLFPFHPPPALPVPVTMCCILIVTARARAAANGGVR